MPPFAPKEVLPWPPLFCTCGVAVCFGAAITSAVEETVSVRAMYGIVLLIFILRYLTVFSGMSASRKNH